MRILIFLLLTLNVSAQSNLWLNPCSMVQPIGFFDGRPDVTTINITDSFWVGEYNMVMGLNRIIRITTDVINLGPDPANFGLAQPPYFEFHALHDHWHLEDFLRFEAFDSCGENIMEADTIVKIGYALFNDHSMYDSDCNNDSLTNWGVDAGEFWDDPTTDPPYGDSVVMAPGWGDIYEKATEGNWIPIPFGYHGTTRIRVTMNPPAWIDEGDNPDGNIVEFYLSITATNSHTPAIRFVGAECWACCTPVRP